MKKIVTIDGHAASGKEKIAKFISRKWKLKHLDSGILYRRLAYILIKKNVKSEIKEVKYYNNASHNIFIKSKDQKVIFHDIYSFIKKNVL